MTNKNWSFETKQLHAGQQVDIATGSRAVPIYQTTSYVFPNCESAKKRFALEEVGNIYTRLTNSTQGVLEERVAALEGGVAALALSSGAAAISYTVLALCNAGDNIVSSKTIYGGTYNTFAHTLPHYGIDTKFVDIHNFIEVEKAIDENTKLIFFETLGNPNSDVADIEKLAEIAHKHNIPLVCDNTFGTPYLVRPIEHGVDIVVHSATKFLGGHGTTLGGIIVDSGKFDWVKSGKFKDLVDANPSYHGLSFTSAVGAAAFVVKVRAILLRDMGACISPFNAFLLLQGIETLSLRIERHIENALKVLHFLNNHKKVLKVNHPLFGEDSQKTLYHKYFPKGAGSIFTFEIDGGEVEAHKFIDSLQLFSLLANVADAKSLIIHPATTTHSQMTKEERENAGIFDNTIRLSIGIENIDDILADLSQGFEKI